MGDTVKYSVGDSPRSAMPGDFNGDGAADISVANLLSDDVNLLLNDGNGNFITSQILPVGVTPCSIITNDLDNEGDLDLAIANRDEQSISIFYNNGTDTFENSVTLSDDGIRAREVRTADFNNDGFVDLVVM